MVKVERPSKNVARLARKFKTWIASGLTLDEIEKKMSDGYKATAERDGWRRSELAVALADMTRAVELVKKRAAGARKGA